MRFKPLTVLETYARNGDFYPDKDRILAAMLFLMNEHPGITQYQIVKSIFLADEEHLNRYGRPVTFDNYVAMPRGPVPSLVLNLLSPERAWEFTEIYQVDPPWNFRLRPSRSGRAFEYYPDHGADMDSLSATDIAALRNGLRVVRELSETDLDKRLHDHPAYVEAWKRKDGKRSAPMKTELLLRREGSADVISDLSFISRP
jgi:hypothetical protein